MQTNTNTIYHRMCDKLVLNNEYKFKIHSNPLMGQTSHSLTGLHRKYELAKHTKM